MVYRDPNYIKPTSKNCGYYKASDDKEATLEDEIIHMEKNRRAIIRKVGGEKYAKLMERLVRKKQKQSGAR